MLNLVPGVQSTSAALTAERTRLDVIAQNIANSNTTRGLDGKPYLRHQVVFEAALNQAQLGTAAESHLVGPRVSRISKDTTRPLRSVYDPGHPHADRGTGMVQLPNVNIHEEMADLIAAGRTFEANLAVLRTAKQMVTQTFSIGKR